MEVVIFFYFFYLYCLFVFFLCRMKDAVIFSVHLLTLLLWNVRTLTTTANANRKSLKCIAMNAMNARIASTFQ